MARPQGGIPFPEDDRKALEQMLDSSGRKSTKPLTGQPANPGYLRDGVWAPASKGLNDDGEERNPSSTAVCIVGSRLPCFGNLQCKTGLGSSPCLSEWLHGGNYARLYACTRIPQWKKFVHPLRRKEVEGTSVITALPLCITWNCCTSFHLYRICMQYSLCM